MIKLTRRWFIEGLVAAPAIVKFNSIMPVKVLPESLVNFNSTFLETSQYNNGPLDLSIITQEAVKILGNNILGVDVIKSAIIQQPTRLKIGLTQNHVNIAISLRDMLLPLVEFSSRILVPAMSALANEIKQSQYRLLETKSIKSEILETPHPECQYAQKSLDGLNLRAIKGYSIGTDQNIIRFDILYKTTSLKTKTNIPKISMIGPRGFLP